MAKKTMTFAPKDRIDHSVYGTGTIVDIDEQRTTIDFDEAGTKKFLTKIIKLAPTDVPAPAKRTRRKATKKKTAAKKKTTKKATTKKAAAKKTTKKKAAAKKTTKKKAATKKAAADE